jgi:hypothetical protein
LKLETNICIQLGKENSSEKLFKSEIYATHIDQELGESSLQVQTQQNVTKQGTEHCYDADDHFL